MKKNDTIMRVNGATILWAAAASWLAMATSVLAAPLRVLPLGDSITVGESPPGLTPGGYRTLLYDRLTTELYPVNFIGSMTSNPNLPTLPDSDHQGNSGSMISHINASYYGWIANQPVPDVVLLHAGTNDVVQDSDLVSAPSRLDSLINKIVDGSSRTQIVVAQIIGSTNIIDDAQIRLYNQGVASVVSDQQAAGHNVTLANMYGAVNVATDLSDAYHPNSGGYDKMANTWFTAVQALGAIEPIRGQTITPTNSTSATQTTFVASSTDLINAGSLALLSTAHQGYTAYSSSNTAALNNGLVGGVNDLAASAFDLDGTWSSTYVLDTSVNILGYNITEIRSIAAFDASRASQKFELFFSFVGDPSYFVSYDFHTLTYDLTGATMLSLTDNTGVIASGVKAIRFDFKDPRVLVGGDESTIRELDVFGTAVPAPEPSSLSMLILGLIPFFLFRRKRR